MTRDSMTRALVRAVKRTPFSRGHARRLTLGIIQRMHPEPIEGTFRNVPFLFHLDNNTEKKALVSDTYDKEELDFLLSALKGRPKTFIDAGANAGLYSMFLASQMRAGSRVVAVEPNPAMCERIELNARLLRDGGFARDVRIDIEAVALGDADGELHLDLSPGHGQALVRDHETKSSVRVPSRTLAGLCREKGVAQIDAMKVDVEGYEDHVLGPFLSHAERPLLPKALVLETVHRDAWKHDVVASLLAAGYRRHAQTRSNVLMTLV